MKLKILLILLVPLIFFLSSLLTLNHYGISWDEPEHFFRGQDYLHFYLTGEKKFNNLSGRVSFYQNNSLPAEHFFANDDGHPPASDILAALTNYIFYQKLGILGDIQSFHLFNILVSTLLVIVVAVFSYKVLGLFSALVSSFVVAFYPLFFAESKFNVKDPAQAAFYTLTIFAFWMSLKRENWKWLIASAVSFGLAFGTKFNILFLPVILILYLFIRFWSIVKKGIAFVIKRLNKISKSYKIAFLLAPLVAVFVFYIFWPFLWSNPLENFLKITRYYKEIGTGFDYQPGYYFGKFNLYPLFWIATTTPPFVLLLTFLGLILSLKDKSKEKTPILWALWFLIPIARVSVPGASIYGGIRQIMEFIPAMGLLVGVVVSKIKSLKVRFLFAIILVVSVLVPIYKYHPNENVYFNFFIGGLRGAVEKKVPYAGNSYGNAYFPITRWLNDNASKDSHLALVQGTALNIPDIMLRSDIRRWNQFWSGFDRKGEYLTELNYIGGRVAYPYAWDYVENFLEPIYQVKVDGVVLSTLWKNDLEHTKESMKRKEIIYKNYRTTTTKDTLQIDLNEEQTLNRFLVSFNEKMGCSKVSGRIQVRIGESWFTEGEPVPTEQITERKMVAPGKLEYYFPAHKGQGVRFISNQSNSCLFNAPKITLFVLE